ncbi:PLP-dependent transferase [Wilcoxina mikolae CBS 423.85]|nr:PLP-dependent transferase [Wilcoxina mikolae CBS 423.85]
MAASYRKPIDLWHHFNDVVHSRLPNPMKNLYKYFLVPGMSNIAGGLPNPSYFPFDDFTASIATPSRLIDTHFHGLTPQKARSIFSRKPPPSSHLSIPKFEPSHPPSTRIDLSTTLQYGRATGLPALTDFLREFTFRHMLQGELAYDETEADILPTCGNTDGFSKVIGALGTRGDTMLVESYCYTAVVTMAAPFGIGTCAVAMDEGGMLAEGEGGLRDVLENWDFTRGRRPHFMYTVTVGQNPTGVTVRAERRREIYKLCERFDVIIIEDTPYWNLQYTPESHQFPGGDVKYPFLAALEKGYLTEDTSGRVIRLDTFSKTIAPGCRLGWITTQKKVIEGVLIAATESSTQQPSGFVQAMVAELVCREWGMDGWVMWLESLRGVYEERMRLMADILSRGKEKIIISSSSDDDDDLDVVTKTQMYEFNPPDGGMFIWVHIHITSHPAYTEFLERGGTKADMMEKLWSWGAITQMTLPSPGGIFAGHRDCRDSADEFMRFCFAAVEVEEVKSATERWVKAINEFWELQAGEIEKIEEEEVVVGKVEGGACL